MLRILVVEDDVNAMQLCCAAIHNVIKDCNIYQAGSAEMAIDQMTRYPIDLFFIDIKLPKMRGDILAGIIRNNPMYALTQIVFVTGFISNEVELHKLYHHYEYVKKPFTLTSFESDIGELLRNLNRIQFEQSEVNCRPDRCFFIEGRGFQDYIKLSDLLYVEKRKRENRLHMVTVQKVYEDLERNLEDFIVEMDDPFFVRCHKSFAVYLPMEERVVNLVITAHKIEVLNYVSVDFDEKSICLFDKMGYSTKGECRGYGLSNVKDIAGKYNGTLKVNRDGKILCIEILFQ